MKVMNEMLIDIILNDNVKNTEELVIMAGKRIDVDEYATDILLSLNSLPKESKKNICTYIFYSEIRSNQELKKILIELYIKLVFEKTSTDVYKYAGGLYE